VCAAQASRSSRARVPHGIRIHLGQTLVVTSGLGWAQRKGGSIEEIRTGDVVWFAPNEKHWHGATPTTAMTHIAIQEALDGKAVEWMEKVSDEQYRR
jgi:quercetin dioxygenase-like cupin family protein